jgi:hypothetical protein
MTSGASRDLSALSSRLAVALLTAFFVAVGVAGVDFGRHWDEPGHFDYLRRAVEAGSLIPPEHIYPGGVFTLLELITLPERLAWAASGATAFVIEGDVLLRARVVFVILCSGIVGAVYALVRACGRSRAEAVFAAAIAATSWELGYHARFVTPDCFMTVLSTGALACAVAAARRRSRRALWGAAALGGLAMGFKYPCGALAFSVAAAALSVGTTRGERTRLVAASAAVFVVAFFVTTPAVVFDFDGWVAGLAHQSRVYGSGWAGYSVDGPLDQLVIHARYLARAALSPFALVALGLAFFAVPGAVVQRPGSIVVAAFFVVYTAIFFVQHVFIARNALPLVPIVAVYAACGVGACVARWPGARALWFVAAGACAAGALDVVHAARTIRARDQGVLPGELGRFLDEHADEMFLTTPAVQQMLHGYEGALRANLTLHEDPRAARVLIFAHEAMPPSFWQANEPTLVDAWFGAREINWNIYPSWQANPRVLLMSRQRAHELDIVLPRR